MRLQDAFAVPVARDNPLVLGPIQVTYRGGARFVEFDETRVTAVLEAKGREILGMGTARASVSMELEQRDIDETEVRDDTDLHMTGRRPARFGPGVIDEVSDRMPSQFMGCLQEEISRGGER